MALRFRSFSAVLAAALMVSGWATSSDAAAVRITVENVGTMGTTYITPVFVGLHDGSFDLSNGGMATPGLEALAELGDTSGLTTEFLGGAPGRISQTLGGGPLAPGTSVSGDFVIGAGSDQLTLATMILPSSDFFLGNISVPAFDLSGFDGTPLTFTLASIYDAGTELNDFADSPGNPFLGLPPGTPTDGEPDPDTSIRLAGADPFDGFLNAPAGGFSPGLSQLQITVTSVPEPSTMIAGCLLVGAAGVRRRLKRKTVAPAAV